MCYLPLLPRPVRHQALLVCSRCRCSNGLLVGSAILGCRAGRAVASLVASHVFAEELVLTGIFEQEMGWNSSIYLNLSNYPIRFLFECLNILARNKAGGRFGISCPVQCNCTQETLRELWRDEERRCLGDQLDGT